LESGVLQEIKIDKAFADGDTLTTEVKIDPPQEPRFIGVVEVWYQDAAQGNDIQPWYRWNFYSNWLGGI
jgi:hypothetical protein